MAISCIMTTTASAQGVKWENGTLQDALNKAKNNKKGPNLVFMDCYTVWCGPCKHMANVIFPTKEAGDYFNKNFVNIKMDMEKGEGIELNKKFKIIGYPTFLILDSDGNEIGRVIGGGELNEFINRIERAKDINNSPDKLLEKYKETKDMDIAYKYLDILSKNMMNDNINSFFTNYFNDFGRYKYRERTWLYAKGAISLKNPAFLNTVLDNKVDFDINIGKGAIDKTLYEVLTEQLTYSYLMGHEKVPAELIDKVCNTLNLIKEPTEYESIIINSARAYSKNDTKKLIELLNNKYAGYSLTPMQYNYLGRILYNIDSIPQEEKDKFKKSFDEFYKKILESYSQSTK